MRRLIAGRAKVMALVGIFNMAMVDVADPGERIVKMSWEQKAVGAARPRSAHGQIGKIGTFVGGGLPRLHTAQLGFVPRFVEPAIFDLALMSLRDRKSTR